MRLVSILSILLALAATASAELGLDDLRTSVVQVDVVNQSADYYTPWQSPRPVGSGGSAFYIGNRRLLTNAHVVSDTKIIRLKRPDRPEKIAARVLFFGHDCDLALITVDEKDFFDGMKPIAISTKVPALRSTVATVGFPTGGRKLSITEGVVSRVELHDYVHTGVDRHLAVQVDAAINPGNSGGPVIQGDSVVGVAFQAQFFAQNIGYMIPTPVIHHFLKDVEDGKYDGYPTLGIYTSSLENPALRSYLKVPDGEKGVVILQALIHSTCEGILKRNDVLHAVDDHAVENDGTVKIDGDFLELAFVVQEKHVGDEIVLKIRRDGAPMTIRARLKKWKVKMDPAHQYEKKPEFLVLGGYVFVPLTSDYMRRAGWRTSLSYWMTEFYKTLAKDRPGQEQLVVLSRVLRHDSTRYRSYKNEVIKTVNGTVPRDFAHFVSLLDAGKRAVIEFEGTNIQPLVLDPAKIAAVQDEILKRYGITKSRHVREED